MHHAQGCTIRSTQETLTSGGIPATEVKSLRGQKEQAPVLFHEGSRKHNVVALFF